MTNKHILLIHAGGTVGMARTAHGYAPATDFPAHLARLLSSAGAALPRYTPHVMPDPIDSSNAIPADWQRIAQDIARHYGACDGVVVLHGTDTMTHAASALSFMLQGLRKPVIVTGSQIPLGEARSDALQNIVTALQLAARDDIREVAVYFGQRLLRGNRATKVSNTRLTAFDSPNHPPLGEVGIDIHLDASALWQPRAAERFDLPPYEAGRILPLRFAPGLPARLLDAMLALMPRALILEGYGAGNLPDNDPDLHRLLRQAHDAGVLLVARSQCLHGGVALDAYATGSALAQAGVIGAADMTFEALYAKLHHLFALGLPADEVRQALLSNLAGELTDPH
ncbi:asparaginase [Noviherbaspirillum humi]|uniref:Asparaginase n=1 Tax=Noviherbaspirillum humi TaxID=1688639 RepID=A0A239CE49_9BURK|nr:asparaginase domain-containing protein [Noviherbaspirillum humi]SNS17633.1 asparaginase [Noviherbaspirillum humi]